MSEEKALTKPEPLAREQIELVKRTVAKGTTDDELKLFLYTAARSGLDPLAKQIHAIKRWSSQDQREVMSIQTGIDGYRLIAERTEKYAPGAEPKYHVEDGRLVSATAYVKKLAGDQWHEVGATAFFDEYAQRNRDGKLTRMWERMPRLMLAKCAEALALRRAFPAEMSGIYTFDEMAQAEEPQTVEGEVVEEKGTEKPPSQTMECKFCGSVNVSPSVTGKTAKCEDCGKGWNLGR